ncbi:hypothetical protein CF326_g3893 [Tilletia indica]|nr:hypothetical protein CF326_g3893 [Tilletia indica]
MPLSDLNGELLVVIVQHVLQDEEDSPLSRIRRLSNLAAVSRRMRAAVTHYLGRNLSLADGARAIGSALQVASRSIPWLPQQHDDAVGNRPYWRHYLGTDWQDVPSLSLQAYWVRNINIIPLKVLSLDLRVKNYDRLGTRWGWNAHQAPQWIQCASILARIACSSSGLEAVHIRLPPQEDAIQLLCDVLAANPNTTDVVVEIDSALEDPPSPRPLLTFLDFVQDGPAAPGLERLVLRAPGCDIDVGLNDAVLRRFKTIKEISIAAVRLRGTTDPCKWILGLLRATPQVEAVEVAALGSEVHSGPPAELLGAVRLQSITALFLDLPNVDARLLRLLHVPNLQHLSIRTGMQLSQNGDCPDSHFPSLSTARISARSTIMSRFQFLGLPRSSYIHNFRQYSEEWAEDHEFDGDFVANIKPNVQSTLSASPEQTSISPRSLWLSSPRSPSALVLTPLAAQSPPDATATTSRTGSSLELHRASLSPPTSPSTSRQMSKRRRLS